MAPLLSIKEYRYSDPCPRFIADNSNSILRREQPLVSWTLRRNCTNQQPLRILRVADSLIASPASGRSKPGTSPRRLISPRGR